MFTFHSPSLNLTFHWHFALRLILLPARCHTIATSICSRLAVVESASLELVPLNHLLISCIIVLYRWWDAHKSSLLQWGRSMQVSHLICHHSSSCRSLLGISIPVILGGIQQRTTTHKKSRTTPRKRGERIRRRRTVPLLFVWRDILPRVFHSQIFSVSTSTKTARVLRIIFKVTKVGETEELVSGDAGVQRHVLRLLSGIKRALSVTHKFYWQPSYWQPYYRARYPVP